MKRLSLLFVLVALLSGVSIDSTATAAEDSKTPPPGAPWQRDFDAAQREALQSGKPIFIYFTKTYCPHCVLMERGVLRDEALEPAYAKAVWLYVFRDFSESVADRAAERVSLRFNLTSWPQHLLVDPETLDVIGDTGRNVPGFLAAVDRAAARVTPSESLAAADRVQEADARAMELEESPNAERAREALNDRDIVVRFRGLHVLIETAPDVIAARAAELLRTPNDPFRYAVCEVLAETPNREAADTLEQIAARPVETRNPNVLRIRAVSALAGCGDEDSVAVIAPFASSGEYLNGLTGTSVDALVAIARREPGAKEAVIGVLEQSFPEPADGGTDVQQRYCLSLARRVNEALERVTREQVEFPAEYNAETRETLIENWQGIATTPDE